jgi:hypothetical protein
MAICDIATVIVYDEIRAGLRAKELCDRVALELAGDVELRVSLWRTDVLGDLREAESALAEATAADLIVLAFRGGSFLSRQVRQWLDRWAADKHVPEPALVVISEESGLASSSATQQLREFARVHGLKCFCANAQGLAGKSDDKSSELGRCLSPIPGHAVEHSHWGIND